MRWPRYRRWAWWLLWPLIALLRPLICRLKVEGVEHIPAKGGAVIACNHTTGPDYLLLALASPRELHFMAKAEIFNWNPVLTFLLRAAGVFPVRRGQGDQSAVGNAALIARQGNLVAMFPEGTRSRTGQLMRGKTGAARIALAAGVPIIPAAVINAPAIFKRRGLRRPLVTVRFGEPVCWPATSDGPDVYGAAGDYTDEIMQRIAHLLPSSLRGVYGNGDSAQVESNGNGARPVRETMHN